MSFQIYGIIEAEDFDVIKNFNVLSASYGSGGKLVQQSGSGTGVLSTLVKGVPGTYDLQLTYFDENDGASRAKIFVDDTQVANWTWNKNLGSPNSTSKTKTTYTVHDVKLDASSTIRIEGSPDGGERFKIDRLDLLPPEDRAAGATLPAFPGAEGFGSTTPGGRGGWIVKVTNLNDSGVGSLRWALEDLKVPRIVVFDVGGQIALKHQIAVQGDVTVAGQTAPGEGITLTGSRLHIVGSDVVIRGLHIRPGSGAGDQADLRDSISVGMEGTTVQRVVIDSNSLSWSVDENASVWAGAKNVTYSSNIIAEALRNSIHPQGAHSMGMLLGEESQNITVLHNLFANNEFRNPQLKDVTGVEFVNNVVYNYGDNGFTAGDATAHVIGNLFMRGPNSAPNAPVRLIGKEAGTHYYIHDNLGYTRTSDGQPDIKIAQGLGQGSGNALVSSSKVFAASGVHAIAADDVYDSVMGSVGARTQGLDPVDTRILRTVTNDTGKVIDSPNQVGTYKAPTSTAALPDKDSDGIPDKYEAIVGSNPNVFDPHGDSNKDGYTNIENYINGLISGFSSSSAASPPSAQSSLLEAESFVFNSGFAKQKLAFASGGAVIHATGSGEQSASITYLGDSGAHDLTLAYFDEEDGASNVAVSVNGKEVDSWTWNKHLGSDNANPATLTSHTTSDVALHTGDVIEISGFADGSEALRIDSLLIG